MLHGMLAPLALPLAAQQQTLDQATDLVTRARDWLVSPEGGIALGLNLIAFGAILFAARILASVLGGIARRAAGSSKLKVNDLLKEFFVTTVRKVVWIVGLVVALGSLGVDIGPLVAGIGVAGFVVGFAMQDTLANFAAGVMILLYRPFDVGDYVEAGGQTGTVEALTLVSTTLLTPDNQRLTVPNGKIWGDTIRNVTASKTRRVDLTFGIGYGDDIAKAERILLELVRGHDKVLAEPEPVVRLAELADSSVNFIVRPWARSGDYWDVHFDLIRAVKERFDAEGISIPFPQRDVHVYQESRAA